MGPDGILRTLSLYRHTLVHLSPVQWIGRVQRALPRVRVPEIPDARFCRPDGTWVIPPRRRATLLGASRFDLLGQAFDVATGADWNSPHCSDLLRYNLHYFEDLNSEGSADRRAWHRDLVNRWISENRPLQGVGWNPYPTSLRIVNWIKWFLSGVAPEERWVRSLAQQVEALSRRPEYDLRANHLFVNGKALLFASAVIGCTRSARWKELGQRILHKELQEQILPDGGHFERSPMYHALILEDVLDLINLARLHGLTDGSFTTTLRTRAQAMIGWLEVMTPPSGELSRFNDSSPGVSLSLEQLRDYARQLHLESLQFNGQGATVMNDSGFVRLQRGPFTVIFNAAPIEPAYNPGHAHADTLSFELTWNSQPVIVNSGTSCYGTGTERARERSTAAHGTVQLDGEDSSEVWAGFRVARRARPFGLEARDDAGALRAACNHDGYRRLSGSPIHRRGIEIEGNTVVCTDEITGQGRHLAIGRFPLHPDIRLEPLSPTHWQLNMPDGKRLHIESLSNLPLEAEDGTFAPEFGRTVARRVLKWTAQGDLPMTVKVILRSV